MEQMTTTGKGGGGEQRRLIGKREERFEIGLAGVGDLHGELVDHFLAR